MKDQDNDTCSPLHVPILLPPGRDTEVVSNLLDKEMIDFNICSSMKDLLNQISKGCGSFILGDEALSTSDLSSMFQILDQQPEWSDLPAIIFLERYRKWKSLNPIAKRRSLYLIQRPVKKMMVVVMVRTALQVRRRQYKTRDLLRDLRQANEKLNQRTHLLQQLALDLTNSEEKERLRIARILHDDLQQILVSAKIQAGMLTDYREKTGNIHTLYDTISRAIDSSRSLSHELNPAFLYGSDLGVILTKIADKMAEDYGLNIETNIRTETAKVAEGLKIFIFRTVQELLLNCAKHSRSDRVLLELIGRDNLLILTATDYGVGFDPVKKLKVCNGKKKGFGLFSIKERTEALGGSFQIESSPNNGSRFVLNVPVGAESSIHETESSIHEKGVEFSDMLNIAYLNDSEQEVEKKTAIRVIIADDHAIMRQGLASLLQNQPDILVAGQASDGAEAVELTLKLRPDVVLMDVSMPLLNGMEATRRIISEAPEVAVIGLSMHASEEVRQTMLEAGACEYLLKDRPASELLSAIKRSRKIIKPDS
jgi:signal transduction histidine kinase/CheY-like chemotaxis protein